MVDYNICIIGLYIYVWHALILFCFAFIFYSWWRMRTTWTFSEINLKLLRWKWFFFFSENSSHFLTSWILVCNFLMRRSLCPRGPPLSNQGTPLIPSCPMRREQYEELSSCVHDRRSSSLPVLVFVFPAESTKLRLPSARWTKDAQIFFDVWLCPVGVLLLSSSHLFKKLM